MNISKQRKPAFAKTYTSKYRNVTLDVDVSEPQHCRLENVWNFFVCLFGNTDFDVDSISYHDLFSSSDAQNIDFITDYKKKETEVPL